MPIINIIEQPNANALKGAYRSIIFKVRATRTDGELIPPVVYCDIYINGTFFKTMERTIYKAIHTEDDDDNGLGTDWEFDIHEPIQEVLSSFIPPNGSQGSFYAVKSSATVQCKFRSSGFNADGFVQYEDDAPKQATATTNAIDGTGTASNTFWVLNCAQQHLDNQDIITHFGYFKNGTWDAAAVPLTHRPNDNYRMSLKDSDHFPIVYTGARKLKKIRLKYRILGQNVFHSVIKIIDEISFAGNIIVNLPLGPKNIKPLFPTVDFTTLHSYYLEYLSDEADPLATSCLVIIENIIDGIRLRFLNYASTYDGANFLPPKVVHEDTSSTFRPRFKNFSSYKKDTTFERFNIISNDTYEVKMKCLETDMKWLQELADSPKIFVEWTGTEGQSDDYYPVIKLDGKFEKLKNETEYDYEFSFQFKLGNEYRTIRN